MAEQSTTAMQSTSGAGLALVFQAGAIRTLVAVDIRDLCPVLEFSFRPWGEPRRCSECGKPVTIDTPACGGALGTVQCQRHQPRALLHGEPDDLHPPVMSWMPPIAAAPGPVHEATPVLADDPPIRPRGTPTMSLRERLAARSAAERTQE